MNKEIISKIVAETSGVGPHANSKFGKKIGKNGKIVSEWRNPTRPHLPSDEDVAKICEVFNINPLFAETGTGEIFNKQQTDSVIIGEPPKITFNEYIKLREDNAVMIHIVQEIRDQNDKLLVILKSRFNNNGVISSQEN